MHRKFPLWQIQKLMGLRETRLAETRRGIWDTLLLEPLSPVHCHTIRKRPLGSQLHPGHEWDCFMCSASQLFWGAPQRNGFCLAGLGALADLALSSCLEWSQARYWAAIPYTFPKNLRSHLSSLERVRVDPFIQCLTFPGDAQRTSTCLSSLELWRVGHSVAAWGRAEIVVWIGRCHSFP